MWPALPLPDWMLVAAGILATRLRLAGVTWQTLRPYVDGPMHLTAAAQEAIVHADDELCAQIDTLAQMTLQPQNADLQLAGHYAVTRLQQMAARDEQPLGETASGSRDDVACQHGSVGEAVGEEVGEAILAALARAPVAPDTPLAAVGRRQ